MCRHTSRSEGQPRTDCDDGSATILLVMVGAALLAVIVLAVGGVGARLVAHQRAQNAADAAALAAVIGGPARATEIARQHGAEIIGLVISDGTATVTVRCGGQSAQARATDQP